LGAKRKVRPLAIVSKGRVGSPVFASDDVCRSTSVKLNMSSSSLERRRRKDGGWELVPLSGSCVLGELLDTP